MKKIACVGDNCIDYYDATGEAFPGGNPVNVAVYIRRMGGVSSYTGAVGNDRFGTVLLDALRTGKIAGAGLDTFETEPLPADSPVWDTSNLFVTPHFTPACPDKLGRSLAVVLENIEHFHKGEPLINQLKPEDKFTKR